MDDNQDPNLKNAELSSKIAVLQNTIREYQEKIKSLSDKVYKSKYHGIEMQMKGDYTLVSLVIDQGVYETSSKSNLEQIIFTSFVNLKKAINDEQEFLSKELQDLIKEYNLPPIQNF